MISYIKADGKAEKELIAQLKARSGETSKKVTESVTEIIEAVRLEGDAALDRYTKLFDGSVPERLEVTKEEMEEAVNSVAPEFLTAVKMPLRELKISMLVKNSRAGLLQKKTELSSVSE